MDRPKSEKEALNQIWQALYGIDDDGIVFVYRKNQKDIEEMKSEIMKISFVLLGHDNDGTAFIAKENAESIQKIMDDKKEFLISREETCPVKKRRDYSFSRHIAVVAIICSTASALIGGGLALLVGG